MPTKATPVNGFFDELKRRKVYRVAVAYVIAAGGIIQIASAVFPAWDLPNWALRLTVVLLLAGFPLALVLAWAFDVTPQGIRATPALVPASQPEAAKRHRRRNIFLLVALGFAISGAPASFCCHARTPESLINRSRFFHSKTLVTTRRTPILPTASKTTS